ncbi:CHAT domain protein [Ceratobasidium sp. AG-Ba]|nr:CHAT domain protein [Ceratobasidium sp. AG-Ba]
MPDARQIQDINWSIAQYHRAISLAPDANLDKHELLHSLSVLYKARFHGFRDQDDLCKAIELQVQAVSALAGASQEPNQLGELAKLYELRFEELGDPTDLDRAISYCERMVFNTSNDHQNRDVGQHIFGVILHTRYNFSFDPTDLERSIICCRTALSLVQATHKNYFEYTLSLAKLLRTRASTSKDRGDLDEAITVCSHAIETSTSKEFSKSHLNALGELHQFIFNARGILEDINKSIGFYKLALARYLHKNQLDGKTCYHLMSLGIALSHRYTHLGEHGDINEAIRYLKEALRIPGNDEASLLVEIGGALNARFCSTGSLSDADEAIICLRKAIFLGIRCLSDRVLPYQNLAVALVSRFQVTGEISDLDESIALYKETIPLLPDGHSWMPALLNGLGNSLCLRFERSSSVADIDEAVSSHIRSLYLTPRSDPKWAQRRSNAAASLYARYRSLGEIADLDAAIQFREEELVDVADCVPLKRRLYLGLGESLMLRAQVLESSVDADRAETCFHKVLMLAKDDDVVMFKGLTELARLHGWRPQAALDISRINQAIAYAQEAMLLLPGHPKSGLHYILGVLYSNRCTLSMDPEDLAQAMDYSNQALLTTSQDTSIYLDMLLAHNSHTLIHSLLTDDFDGILSAVESAEYAARLPIGSPMRRLEAIRDWADLADSQHLQADQLAFDVLPQVLWLGMSVQRRYEVIQKVGDIPVVAAADAIDEELLDQALEWLEEGRSIVWQQYLNLRRPLDELYAVSPRLAERLRSAARGLDRVNLPSSSDFDLENPQSIERESQRYRQCAIQWDQTLSQVRAISGLQEFLRPTKAARFLTAAHWGPIVVINLSYRRCDALVLVPGAKVIEHVSLPDISLEEVIKSSIQFHELLQQCGAMSRGVRRCEKPGKEKFEAILAMLWTGIVKPIFGHLGILSPVPLSQRPHITWCPTGPLAFLPLHAAGIYSEPKTRVYNYAVSSYTPTVNDLLRSQETPSEFTGIMAIGQSETTGHSPLPGTIAELAEIKKHAKGHRWTEISGAEATTERVLSGMQEHSWVHLACHGVQNMEDPTKSALILSDGPLELAAIMSKPIRRGGLAYLSACQTAAGTMYLPYEAVHIAAGLMMAGYSSVIATMWSIMDSDAPKVADGVYGELIRDGVPNSRRAAWALDSAVASLRDQVGEGAYERWVPYIHLGC